MLPALHNTAAHSLCLEVTQQHSSTKRTSLKLKVQEMACTSSSILFTSPPAKIYVNTTILSARLKTLCRHFYRQHGDATRQQALWRSREQLLLLDKCEHADVKRSQRVLPQAPASQCPPTMTQACKVLLYCQAATAHHGAAVVLRCRCSTQLEMKLEQPAGLSKHCQYLPAWAGSFFKTVPR